MTENIITVEMLEALRLVHDGVIVADAYGQPLVRSRIHYDGPDPLDTGEQIIVIDGDPAHDQECPDTTDEEIAAYLSEQRADLVNEAHIRSSYRE